MDGAKIVFFPQLETKEKTDSSRVVNHHLKTMQASSLNIKSVSEKAEKKKKERKNSLSDTLVSWIKTHLKSVRSMVFSVASVSDWVLLTRTISIRFAVVFKTAGKCAQGTKLLRTYTRTTTSR